MAVTVDTGGDAVQVGTPTELFRGDYVMSGPTGTRMYHVAPDGRFLMMVSGDAANTDEQVPPRMVVVLNWHQELLERVPVN